MERKTRLTITALLALSQPIFSNQLIQRIIRTPNKVTVVAHDEFHNNYLIKDFFTEYDPPINVQQMPLSVALIPFYANAFPIVWLSGNTYTIDEIDKDQYESLQIIKKVFQAFYPKTNWSGQVKPKKLIHNRMAPRKNSAVTLFSHGLDALHTALVNRNKKQTLVTVWGTDVSLKKPYMWQNVKELCIKFGKHHNCTNCFVKSNFKTFYNHTCLCKQSPEIHNWFAMTGQGLGYTSLAAPIAYTKQCPEILIGSTRTSEHPHPYGTHPIIDNNLRYAEISVSHDSPEHNRIDKITDIKTLFKNKEKPFIRVCWGKNPNGKNCGACEKCIRTTTELVVSGEDPRNYGFEVTPEATIKNARTLLLTKPPKTGGLIWHWRCTQNAIAKKHQQNHYPFDAAITKPFFNWLGDYDLTKNHKLDMHNQHKLKTLKELWHKTSAKKFTPEDLKLLAK